PTEDTPTEPVAFGRARQMRSHRQRPAAPPSGNQAAEKASPLQEEPTVGPADDVSFGRGKRKRDR
ncbi:MAG: hypothetical protein KKA42_02055, partial [candidate division Zixibacteria bacterium]|nr:hypothetical protein [candidate division Zixibacteria bacterium]